MREGTPSGVLNGSRACDCGGLSFPACPGLSQASGSHLSEASVPSRGQGRVWGGLPPMAHSSSTPTVLTQPLLGHPKSIFRAVCLWATCRGQLPGGRQPGPVIWEDCRCSWSPGAAGWGLDSEVGSGSQLLTPLPNHSRPQRPESLLVLPLHGGSPEPCLTAVSLAARYWGHPKQG